MEPTFDFKSIDIITDRNNLRKLLKWISGDRASFRIDVQRVGNTVLFQRWDEKILDVAIHGYGREFELASTVVAPGCIGTAGHYRMVTYVRTIYLSARPFTLNFSVGSVRLEDARAL
jgi:hypothetical protein